MPQTSEEVQQAIDVLLGKDEEYMQDVLAERFLSKRGWKLLMNWTWQLPKPDYQPDKDQLLCVQYLIEEWDYGGIER